MMSADSYDKAETRTAWGFLAPFLFMLTIFFAFCGLAVGMVQFDRIQPVQCTPVCGFLELCSAGHRPVIWSCSALFAVLCNHRDGDPNILAMLLAVFVNRMAYAKGLTPTILYFPSIVSSTVMTLIFLWLFQRQGIVTDILNGAKNNGAEIVCFVAVLVLVQAALVLWSRRTYVDVRPTDPFFLMFSILAAIVVTVVLRISQVLPVGEETEAISWLNTRETTLFMPRTLWAIAVMNIFTTVPTMMLLYLAGLQSISGQLYEAAYIDGVTKWQQFLQRRLGISDKWI